MIKIVQGSIVDANEEYIVQQCDCISTIGTDLDTEYLEEFEWADIYGERIPLACPKGTKPLHGGSGFRNIANPDSRGKPGSIKLFSTGNDDEPKVLAMFSQFCSGKPFTGVNSKRRYKDDTSENRLQWFTECLKRITELKPESVGFPDKIGCLNDNGADWEVYSDKLQEFADENPECYILLYCDVLGDEEKKAKHDAAKNKKK